MPEGDTIYRAARHLRRALVGRPILDFSLPGRPKASASVSRVEVIGRRTTEVESRGKNLLFWFDGELALYTHMKMTGSWHVYRPGEPWRKPKRQLVAKIETKEFWAICFNAPVVELLSAARVRRHPTLSQLGPDLLADNPNFENMLVRLRARPDLTLGEALLDQRVLAGIGNVYKSEVCFLLGLSPFQAVKDFDDHALNAALQTARRLMLENLGTFRRTTRYTDKGGHRHWVYGRNGESCYKCRTKIALRRQGDSGRSTYYCPNCQPPLDIQTQKSP